MEKNILQSQNNTTTQKYIFVNINGRQRHELPIDSHPQYNNKTQEDFTSGIETRPGMAPPLWPPNQQ